MLFPMCVFCHDSFMFKHKAHAYEKVSRVSHLGSGLADPDRLSRS